MQVVPMNFGVFGNLDVPLGLGLLGLSHEKRPEEAAAIDLIHAALDYGIRVLDTADVYGSGGKDLHYGEGLVRKALESWAGDRDTVHVVTKAGLERPRGRWRPNAKPAHLREAVEGSLKALGIEQIFMLMLHVKDPGTPFEDSLKTLAALQAEGKVRHLGLCNTSIPEVRQAQRHFDVMAIQNELGVQNRKSATQAVVALADQIGAAFMAHRPFGGHANATKLSRNRAVKPLAAKHGIPPHEAALAVLLNLDRQVLPLIGPTRRETLDSCIRALDHDLDAEDWATLSEKISFTTTDAARLALETPSKPAESATSDDEIVIIMGIQGSGKSTVVEPYLEAGYERLNRDLIGGKLDDMQPLLADHLAAGRRRVVLDNTYPTQTSRFPIVQTAHRHGVPVRCQYLATSFNDATINVANRILERYGKLLGPEEMKELGKTDPNLPPPVAMKRWAAGMEPPIEAEGFSAVETIPFVRRPGRPGSIKGLLLDVDGTIRTTKSGENYPRTADNVVLLPNRREVLQGWIDDGYQLFFVSNQSGVASGKFTAEDAAAAFARTIELLGLPVAEVSYCPHPAFPVGCFCRKPLPGLAVHLCRTHDLITDQLVMVGDMESDRRFAETIGATYYDADTFFTQP
ncbi:MAG: histidinol-phosphate phosphatase family protein [Rhodothermales bacterium]|jgi:histidinol-phosphate phosphatase family protein